MIDGAFLDEVVIGLASKQFLEPCTAHHHCKDGPISCNEATNNYSAWV